VPPGLLGAAKQVAPWRYGIDWAAMDHTADPRWLTVPTLVLQGRHAQAAAAQKTLLQTPVV
jgi:hypothetical protein